MSFDTFSAYLVTKSAAGTVQGGVQTLRPDELPPGDVLIKVSYSSLNYKDALSATGHPGVARKLPHVPGIDAVGVIEASTQPDLHRGQSVIVTSYDLGAGRWGGWSEFIRVPADWVVPLPPSLSPRESMILGTAGLTAAMSLDALVRHGLRPTDGPVLVTGATGGVGSWAVALLSRAGYEVVASSGKPDAAPFLRELGAAEILPREQLADHSPAPLLKARWAGAIDTVGGNILANVLRGTQSGGCVTACGLTGGAELPLTVYPFILRGITLCGIDSATYPMAHRLQLWERLAGAWRTEHFDRILAQETTLSEVSDWVPQILAGKVRGRVIVKI